jgi:hypothetical protein
MAMFNSYVSLPEGILLKHEIPCFFFRKWIPWPVEDASVAPPNAHSTRAIPGAQDANQMDSERYILLIKLGIYLYTFIYGYNVYMYMYTFR